MRRKMTTTTSATSVCLCMWLCVWLLASRLLMIEGVSEVIIALPSCNDIEQLSRVDVSDENYKCKNAKTTEAGISMRSSAIL